MKGIMRPWTAVSAALLCGAAMAAHALENEGGIKLRLAGYAEGDPLLTGNPDNESREAYLDLKTVLHTRFSPNNATFIKLQGFLPGSSQAGGGGAAYNGPPVQAELLIKARKKQQDALDKLASQANGVDQHDEEDDDEADDDDSQIV